MPDPLFETLRYAAMAVTIGAIIFGGTTLAAVLDRRRQDPPRHAPVRQLRRRARPVDVERPGRRHDEAA